MTRTKLLQRAREMGEVSPGVKGTLDEEVWLPQGQLHQSEFF